MGATGLEPCPKTPVNSGFSETGGAKSGALSAKNGENPPAGTPKPSPAIPPDLSQVIDAWPSLPEALKIGIVAMVKAAGVTDKGVTA